MQEPNFILIGYDCPVGSYPSPVVPIVRDDIGDYKAVYLDDNSEIFLDPVDPSSKFMNLNQLNVSIREHLQIFDCYKHRLFAITEQDVRLYDAQSEVLFFAELLKDKSFSKHDPFVRLSLAKDIDDSNLLNRELEFCEQHIQKNSPELLHIWRRNKAGLIASSRRVSSPLITTPILSIRSMGADFGSSTTSICLPREKIVLREPSTLAFSREDNTIVAIGKEAEELRLEASNLDNFIFSQLRESIVTNSATAEAILKYLTQRVYPEKTSVATRMVIGIPSEVGGVERRAMKDGAFQAGAREVYLIDEAVAAAIGAGLPVQEPIGNMIIDIGGGTTEVAVLSLQGTLLSESVRIAGDELSDSITQYMKKVHNLVIGERTAEEIKIAIGSAYPMPDDDDAVMEVRGLHLLSGLPRTVTIKGPEIRESMSEPLSVIIEAVKRTLERTPPELAADIIDRGIMLAGGGALLKGIDTLISHETGIVTHIAPNPQSCVISGTRRLLEVFDSSNKLSSRLTAMLQRTV